MKDSSKINILNILSCLIVIYLVFKAGYMIANVISFSVAANIPCEHNFILFRVAQSFLAGKNPYSLEALSAGTVPLVYMYTFLQPLCVAAVCRLTGLGVLAGNFTVNLLCILGTAVCIWLIVKDSIGNNTYWGGGHCVYGSFADGRYILHDILSTVFHVQA